MAIKRMEFWRECYDGSGCLEFSWVPNGSRLVIELPSGVQEGVREDVFDERITNVQVYVLNNNCENTGPVSTEMWMFPAHARENDEIVKARIEVYPRNHYATGTVWYASGQVLSHNRTLDFMLRQCPTGARKTMGK